MPGRRSAANGEAEAAVEDMTRAEKEAHEDGVALAEKYKAEVEARDEDDPLVLQKRDAEPGEAVPVGAAPASEEPEDED
jgi:hypothetical protein